MRRMIFFLSILFMLSCDVAFSAQQWAFIRYREHATDCRSLVDGGYYDQCRQLSDNNWYACRPNEGVNGLCDTPAEWQQIVSDSGINLWVANASGDMIASNQNANVGIGTTSPNAKVQVVGIVNADLDVTVNNDSVCRLSGANCPPPVFFNPSNYTTINAWGNGTQQDWYWDTGGASRPRMNFQDGLISIYNSALRIYGTTSRIKFGNSMFISGTESRTMTFGSLNGTNNEILNWDNDTKPHWWLVSGGPGMLGIDWTNLSMKTTSLINNFGAVSIGTSGTGASIATITGNVSIGTSNFNNAAPANGMIVQGNVGIGTVNVLKQFQVNGDIYYSNNAHKIYHKKPDNSCCYESVDNTNALTCVTVACP